MSFENLDVSGLILRGTHLLHSNAAVLEQELQLSPANLEQRLLLIGYYFIHHYCFEQARLNRVAHILWLINNDYVDAYTLSFCYVHLVERDAYSSIKAALERALSHRNNDAHLLYGLSRFSIRHKPDYAIVLQQRCLGLQSENFEFQESLKENLEQRGLLVQLRDEFLHEPFEDYFPPERTRCNGACEQY